jgi:hypothetical protein
MVERRQKLAAREVAGAAEHHIIEDLDGNDTMGQGHLPVLRCSIVPPYSADRVKLGFLQARPQ